MNDNGVFRKKNGFTITGNTLTRDTSLSLKAKGLYLIIASYITLPDLNLTKEFLMNRTCEGKKAFDSAWNELKNCGYLKLYLQPKGNSWSSEYELLDEPKLGAHTFYLNTKGEVTTTNEDRKIHREQKRSEILQNGMNANGCNGNGINVKGGNNIRHINNTTNKTINNNQSFLPAKEIKKEGKEGIIEELLNNKGIPYVYNQDSYKMRVAVQYLADWDDFHKNGYEDEFKLRIFNLAVECLIEMACESEIKEYNKRRYSYANVIDKINQYLERQGVMNLRDIIEQTVEDYSKVSYTEEIKYPKKYIKSCILENFDTYEVKFGGLFNRTYYQNEG